MGICAAYYYCGKCDACLVLCKRPSRIMNSLQEWMEFVNITHPEL